VSLQRDGPMKHPGFATKGSFLLAMRWQ
jgi:hypothetical protein